MIDSIAFQLGPLSVRWYGKIMATAFLLGTVVASRQAKKEGIDPDHIYNMLLWIVPSAILGARTYYVIFEWENYQSFYKISRFTLPDSLFSRALLYRGNENRQLDARSVACSSSH
jgi:prolipoprotein diacylglyceryltransferase